MPNISIYPKIYETQKGKEVELNTVLRAIKEGRWASQINYYRGFVKDNGKDSREAKGIKNQLPYITVSGTFKNRSEDGLKEHSGFAAIDIDSLTSEQLINAKEAISNDIYTYSCFVSCSGNGLCVIVKINPENHIDIFKSLEVYYLDSYGIGIDFLADISRPRFISYDPELFLNESSVLFDIELIEEKEASTETYSVIETIQDDELIQKSIDIIERDLSWEKGNRHKYILALAKVANKFGVSQHALESYVSLHYPHFSQNPSNAISWTYKRKANDHGSYKRTYLKTETRQAAITPTHPSQEEAEGKPDFLETLKEREAKWGTPIKAPSPIISVQGGTIATAGNITLISGYSKSGKSGVLGAIIAGSMKMASLPIDTLGFDIKVNEEGKALVSIDTEQSKYNFDRNYRNAVNRAGRNEAPEWFKSVWLKGLPLKEVLEYTWKALDYYSKEFNGIYGIIIDGIGDYVRKANDEEESGMVVEEFAKMAETYNCPLITVLHLNFGSTKQRGHLGSILRRKCESVMNVIKDEGDPISKISWPLLRNAGLVPKINFEYDILKGYHAFSGYEDTKSEKQRRVEKLQTLADSTLTVHDRDHDDLINELKRLGPMSESMAARTIKQMKREGIIIENGFGNYSKQQAPQKIQPQPENAIKLPDTGGMFEESASF